MVRTEKLMEIYAANVAPLLALARSIVRDAGEAEDVLQDVMVSLLEHPEKLRDVERPLPFLRACVRNMAVSHVRSLSHETPSEDSVFASLRSGAESEYREVEDIIWLSELLKSLPDDMREAFVSYALDGRSIKEIARETGLAPDTLRKRFSSIKKRIRKEEKWGTETDGRRN